MAPEQTLHSIATEARAATRALSQLVEVQEKKALRRFVFTTLVAIPAAVFISIVSAMGVVSECFLSEPGKTAIWCEAMPGYSEAREKSKLIDEEFKELQDKTRINDKRLDRLEKEILGRP
jgi:hypothetical protein